MVPTFTKFYLPILQVLNDCESWEIHALIEAVANHTGLSAEDRKIMTRKGQRPRYVSNIWWAVTDLAQAAFVERPSRGHYKITLAGIKMLEDTPLNPNREYLAKHSASFQEFMERKGTRPRKGSVEEEESEEEITPEEIEESATEAAAATDDLDITLKELYEAMRSLRKAKISTAEVEAKASELEERLIRERILPLLSQQIAPALSEIERGLVLVVDYTPGQEVRVSLSRRVGLSAAMDAKEITAN